MTAKAVLAAVTNRRVVAIDLARFGLDANTYHVRSLTERERSSYEAQFVQTDGKTINRSRLIEAKARLVVLCLVTGKTQSPVFTEDDLPALMDADSDFIDTVYEVARKHCGFKRGDVEKLAGNSEETTDDA